jgi:hypothetical protein
MIMDSASSNAPMLNDAARDYGRFRLWFALVGGAVAWLVHLMGAYVIAEFGCVGTTQEYSVLGVTLVAWLLVGLTLLTCGVAVGATLVARGMEHARTDVLRPDDDAVRSIAHAGALTSGISAFVILFESVPILYYLHGC